MEENKIKVSVIMPVYKVEEYVGEYSGSDIKGLGISDCR